MSYHQKKSDYVTDDAIISISLSHKIKFLAKSLYENKIIGFVYGKAEFGPRALGHRSIIACPKKNIINFSLTRVKSSPIHRDWRIPTSSSSWQTP